jgi:hypothetical protein
MGLLHSRPQNIFTGILPRLFLDLPWKSSNLGTLLFGWTDYASILGSLQDHTRLWQFSEIVLPVVD